MSHWEHNLDIADVWRDQALTWQEKRSAIVVRIKAASWYRLAVQADEFCELDDIVKELEAATTVADFDSAWSWFYDWADAERLWVNIHSPRVVL